MAKKRKPTSKPAKRKRHHSGEWKYPKSKQMERGIHKKRHALPMGLSIYDKSEGQGKPAYVPTDGDRRFVRRLTACGLTHEEVAGCIQARYDASISVESLQRHFPFELRMGKSLKVAYVGNRLFQKIREGNLSAMMFFLKTQGKWSSQVNLGDPNGNPLAAPTVEVMFGADEEVTVSNKS